jgi:dihydroorotase
LKNSKKAIINGTLFIGGRLKPSTLLVSGNTIESIENPGFNTPQDYEIIDADNCIVSYGFLDPHVHFRVPGAPHKEDWNSGSRAALRGGFTRVFDMPNNNPSATSVEVLRQKHELASTSLIRHGFHLGLSAKNAKQCRQILDEARSVGIPVHGIKAYLGSTTGNLLVTQIDTIYNALETGEMVLFHCEDHAFLQGQDQVPFKVLSDHHHNRPGKSETVSIEAICSAASTIKHKARIYICHLSTGAGALRIDDFRKEGFTIYSEVTPHHLFLNIENLAGLSPQSLGKCNPPIRPKSECITLQRMLSDDFFSCTGSDHAPHLVSEKETSNPPSGIPGIETSFYVLCSLYEQGVITMEQALHQLTAAYSIFGIEKSGDLAPGNLADITIIRKKQFTYKHSESYTKADFSPFDGILSAGYTVDTVLVDGVVRMVDGSIKTD